MFGEETKSYTEITVQDGSTWQKMGLFDQKRGKMMGKHGKRDKHEIKRVRNHGKAYVILYFYIEHGKRQLWVLSIRPPLLLI